jgi:hypothetical protein
VFSRDKLLKEDDMTFSNDVVVDSNAMVAEGGLCWGAAVKHLCIKPGGFLYTDSFAGK